MAVREFLSATDFSTPDAAMDLYSNVVRRTRQFNVFKSKKVFEAIILSRPYFLVDAQVTDESAVPNVQAEDEGRLSKFAFKARILGNPSPHDYLPDPCAMDAETDEEQAAIIRVVNLHTTFVSTDDYTRAEASLPNVGDRVTVELEKNVHSYNLQFGKFISLADNTVGTTLSPEEACISTRLVFAGAASVDALTADASRAAAAAYGACGRNYTGPATTVVPGQTRSAADLNTAYSQIAAVSGWAEKIIEVCNSLGIPDPAWLANVMYFETGQTLDPSIINSIGCAGLIQFCRTTGARTVGKTPQELAAMGAIEQMDYVETYLRASNPGGNYNAPVDLYMTIFFPAGINRPNCLLPDWAIRANNGIYSPLEYARRADLAARIPIAT